MEADCWAIAGVRTEQLENKFQSNIDSDYQDNLFRLWMVQFSESLRPPCHIHHQIKNRL